MTNSESNKFQDLGVMQPIIDVLSQSGITVPTPIQTQAIPGGIEGKDIVGIAQTGTGKTFAFGLPMIQQLLEKPNANGLVLVPTRELAQQVYDSLRGVAHAMRLTLAVIIGGAPMDRQIGDLKRRPRIVVATPGRLIDHMKRRTLDLRFMEVVVMDEADRMLDMGFAPQIEEVMKKVSPKRQTMLFSATMPPEIMALATKYMNLPIRIEVAPAGTTALLIAQEVFVVDKNAKATLLEQLLAKHKGKVLVFTRTKHGAKNLCFHLQGEGFQVSELHSNKSLSQRKNALADFKSEKTRILIATDIAARGIDVKDIELVVNYDLPENSEDYVHRIGRTGRAGSTGKAVSFASPDQRGKLMSIERLIRKAIPTTKMLNLATKRLTMRPGGDRDERPRHSSRPSSGGSRSGGYPRSSSSRSSSSSGGYPPRRSDGPASSAARPARPTFGGSKASPSSFSSRPPRASAGQKPFSHRGSRPGSSSSRPPRPRD